MKRILTMTLCTLLVALAASPLFAADKPRIAVLEFENKANSGWHWWTNRGAEAMQDVFVTELVKSGKFRVIDRERLDALMREKNLALSGDVDPSTAVQAGKLLGVEYFLVGSVTEYGATDVSGGGPGRLGLPSVRAGKKTFVAAANARIIDAQTGEILWADEARGEDSNVRVRVGGFGGGVDNDERMFDKVMKPVVQELTASIKAADL
ncbi:MAG TPA: CsgG/HfaB family protein [Thermoanaerobaculia bacterium]|nr:CsgG/HfaB family protein [Thermoanaerobaculia bacterium]